MLRNIPTILNRFVNVYHLTFLSCIFWYTILKTNLVKSQSQILQQKRVIYDFINDEKCLHLKVYEYASMTNSYEKEKDRRVEGLFYHFDDSREILFIEKAITSDEMEIYVLFWKKKLEINIVLQSCRAMLKENKKELYKIIDRFK